MNLLKLTSILITFLLSVWMFSCDNNTSEETAEEHHEDEANVAELTAEQIRIAGIELGSIEEKQISGTIKVNGVLDVPPQQLVSISAPLGGFLKTTSLLEGSKVKKGQVIAVIENLDFIQIQQDYLEAKGNFEFAKADYERQQNLASENVNSEKTLQQSRTNFTSWQARYSGLREKLKVLNINASLVEDGNLRSTINLYSPINGYVTQVNANIGKFVNPTDVLFEIVDTEHLHAELIVFEKDVPKLKIGQKVHFTLANENKDRLATVFLIGREISKDRTIQIHCHIDKKDKELLPGMYLNAVVEAGGALVPALPDEAIVDYQGRKYIFGLSEDAEHTEESAPHEITEGGDEHEDTDIRHFQMVEVEVGNSEFGFTEIVSSDIEELKEKQIVVKGAYAVLSTMKNSEEEGGHAH